MAIVTVHPPDPNLKPMEEIGRSGFANWYGNIEERFLKELYGTDGITVFDEMRRRDPSLRAVLFATKLMARTSEWRAVSPTDKPGPEQEATEYLQSCIEDMSHTMGDAVDFQLTMLPFGWAQQEICYKRREGADGEHASQFDDGKIGWRKWAPRKQKAWYKWELDDHGGLMGMHQAPNDVGGGHPYIPIEKALHFVTENDGGDPEGMSIFEGAYEHWYFLKNLLPSLGIGFERSFVGLPKFKYLTEPSPADKALVKNVGRGLLATEKAFVSVPEHIEFELLSTNNMVAEPMLRTIQYFRLLMLQACLADFINLGAGETGSWSLGQDKSQLFIMAVNGWLNKIEEVLNRFAVPRLFRFNEFPGLETLPQLQHSVIEKPDLLELGQFLTAISPLINLGDEDEIWIRGRSGMPEVVEREPGETEPVDQAPAVEEGGEAGEGDLSQAPFDLADLAAPPELPDIGSFEALVLDLLTFRKGKLAARLAGRAAMPPNRWWDEEEREWIQALLPGFEELGLAGARAAAAQVTGAALAVDWTLLNTAVTDWARRHAGQLAKGLNRTSRKALGSQIAAWMESGEPLPDLIARLERVYGPVRARAIAVTEVTRAYTEGSKIAWADSGVVEGFLWQTANDKDVCEICKPLNGKRVYAGEPFPGDLLGPPAHVNCRCWLSPVMIGEKI